MSKRRRTRRTDGGSREWIFRAGCQEFAAKGFAGASVDRIAAAAGVNKAMIYYHFKSKAALYREILNDMFAAVAARLDSMAAKHRTPEGKIRSFVEAIAREAEARPHFPPIWFREIAEGGAHLEAGTLKIVGGIVQRLAAMIREGTDAGRFTPVDPLLVHAGIVGPLLLYYASGQLRKRLARAGVARADSYGADEVIAHVQRVALGTLEGKM
jgi:TetR/AcrR family transcriptional regulator